MMVRIDMTAMVLSPLLAGQVMTSFNTGWGCAFIGFWNIISFVIEYYMLWAVYKSCPALAVKAQRQQPNTAPEGHPEGKTSILTRSIPCRHQCFLQAWPKANLRKAKR